MWHVEDEVQIVGISDETMDDGSMVTIGQLEINGQEVYVVDVDHNGTFDLMGADVNGDGVISENEVYNIQGILVPSPNVAEDHQTKNALALVDKGAAIYVKDVEAKEKLLPVALETIANPEKLQDLSKNIAKLALPDSATIIAKEVLKSLSPCPSPVGRGE